MNEWMIFSFVSRTNIIREKERERERKKERKKERKRRKAYVIVIYLFFWYLKVIRSYLAENATITSNSSLMSSSVSTTLMLSMYLLPCVAARSASSQRWSHCGWAARVRCAQTDRRRCSNDMIAQHTPHNQFFFFFNITQNIWRTKIKIKIKIKYWNKN